MQKLTVKSSGSSTKVTNEKTDFDKAVEELVKKGYFEFMDGIYPDRSDVFIAGKLINVKDNTARYIKAIDVISRHGRGRGHDIIRDIIRGTPSSCRARASGSTPSGTHIPSSQHGCARTPRTPQ